MKFSAGSRQKIRFLTFLLASFGLLPQCLVAQSADAVTKTSHWRRAEPGGAAAEAFALFNTGQTQSACEVLLKLLRNGPDDPWTYHGAMLCAVQAEGFRQPVEDTLATLPADSPLSLYARGFLHVLDKDGEQAEPLLEQALDRAPELALAWDALAAVSFYRRDYTEATQRLEKALDLAPGMALALRNSAQVKLFAEVFERLLARLSELPGRWERVHEPVIPFSGRPQLEILDATPEATQEIIRSSFLELVYSPLEERADLIRMRLVARELSEADLWIPIFISQEEWGVDHEHHALILEAGLQWAEALGRRDGMLAAASAALSLLLNTIGAQELLPVCKAWSDLPMLENAETFQISVILSYTRALNLAGQIQQALSVVERAHSLSEEIGSEFSQALTWSVHGDVFQTMGRFEEARDAFRRARNSYTVMKEEISQAYAWANEAEALEALGEIDQSLEAYRRARRLFDVHGHKIGSANTWLGEGQIQLNRGQLEKSRSSYVQARQLYEEIGSKHGIAMALKGEAHVLLRLGEPRRPLAMFRKASEIAASIDLFSVHGDALMGEAIALFRLGDETSALRVYDRAIDLFRVSGSKIGEAYALRGKGDILTVTGGGEEAMACYRKAIDIFDAIRHQQGVAETQRGIGDLLNRLGKLDEAQAYYQKSQDIFRAISGKPGEAYALDRRAPILRNWGRNEGALRGHRKARIEFQKASDPLGEGNALVGEARILFLLGEDEQALRKCREARVLFERVGDYLGQTNVLLTEFNIHHRARRDQQAYDALFQAREIAEISGDRGALGGTFLAEGEVDLALGKYDSALRSFRKARRIFAELEIPGGQGESWHGEAKLLGDQERWQEAAAAAARAKEYYKMASDIEGQIDVALLGMWASAALDDEDAAISLGEEAIQLHVKWRTTLITDRHRTELDIQISGAYDWLIFSRSWRQGMEQEVLRLAEEARSRVLLDHLATGPRTSTRPLPEEIAEEERRLQKDLSHIESAFHEADRSQRFQLDTQRRRLTGLLNWNRYEALAAQNSPLLTGKPLGAGEIQSLSQETGPILLYYTNLLDSVAFLLTPERTAPFAWRIDISRQVLKDKVDQLRYYLANPVYEDRAENLRRELWGLLIEPFAEHIPIGAPLTLILHGSLHQLAFEALLDPAGYPLFKRWHVSVAPSVSTLAICRQRHVEPSVNDTLMSISSGRGLSLPERETAEIGRFFNAHREVAASFRQYREEVPYFRQVLISSRGMHEQGSRSWTYVELRADEEHDSRLSAAEIATIPINAELVTLAACSTGAGEALLSDERLDLSRAFLIAGAASVLATRWNVPEDERTSRFLVDYYREYRNGGTDRRSLRKDVALSKARRLAIERGDPAQIWAAWVLVGDPR